MTWVWWTVLGAVAFGLVLLVLACLPLLGRTRPLARAVRRLQARAVDAERLRPRVEALQHRAEDLQLGVARVQEQAAGLRRSS